MGQRLVLRAKKEVSIAEIQDFAKKALEYGLNLKEPARIEIAEDGSLRIVADLPAGVRVVGGKKHIVRPQTKKQVAVEKQVAEVHEKKANGEHVAHVPPVSGQKHRKVKCSVCNIRKPVIKRSDVSVVKPHIYQGKKCEGGGQPVPSSRRSASKKKSEEQP